MFSVDTAMVPFQLYVRHPVVGSIYINVVRTVLVAKKDNG